MSIDAAMARWLIGGLCAAILALLAATLRAGRLSKEAETSLKDVSDLVRAIFGDTRAIPPLLGLALRVDQLEKIVAAQTHIQAAVLRAFKVSGTDPAEIVRAIREAIADAIADGQVCDTGVHPAVTVAKANPSRPALRPPLRREED